MRIRKEERAQQARAWLEHLKQYDTVIQASIANTVIYEKRLQVETHHVDTRFAFINVDTASAIHQLDSAGKIGVLNFASYLKPGGGFLSGAFAQEEALCHKSTLYPVLSSKVFKCYYSRNHYSRNRSLYEDKALYSPNILFIDGERVRAVDVITCAAPNRTAFLSRGGDPEEAEDAMYKRADFIFRVATSQSIDTLVLGAWGCGVFGNDPYIVSDAFGYACEAYPVPNVVFAVLDKSGENRDAFERFAI